jgi:hypothetical protein
MRTVALLRQQVRLSPGKKLGRGIEPRKPLARKRTTSIHLKTQ